MYGYNLPLGVLRQAPRAGRSASARLRRGPGGRRRQDARERDPAALVAASSRGRVAHGGDLAGPRGRTATVPRAVTAASLLFCSDFPTAPQPRGRADARRVRRPGLRVHHSRSSASAIRPRRTSSRSRAGWPRRRGRRSQRPFATCSPSCCRRGMGPRSTRSTGAGSPASSTPAHRRRSGRSCGPLRDPRACPVRGARRLAARGVRGGRPHLASPGLPPGLRPRLERAEARMLRRAGVVFALLGGDRRAAARAPSPRGRRRRRGRPRGVRGGARRAGPRAAGRRAMRLARRALRRRARRRRGARAPRLALPARGAGGLDGRRVCCQDCRTWNCSAVSRPRRSPACSPARPVPDALPPGRTSPHAAPAQLVESLASRRPAVSTPIRPAREFGDVLRSPPARPSSPPRSRRPCPHSGDDAARRIARGGALRLGGPAERHGRCRRGGAGVSGPTVAVVIPVLNEAGNIAALLEDPGASGETDAVVVDAGSTDGTREVVAGTRSSGRSQIRRAPAWRRAPAATPASRPPARTSSPRSTPAAWLARAGSRCWPPKGARHSSSAVATGAAISDARTSFERAAGWFMLRAFKPADAPGPGRRVSARPVATASASSTAAFGARGRLPRGPAVGRGQRSGVAEVCGAASCTSPGVPRVRWARACMPAEIARQYHRYGRGDAHCRAFAPPDQLLRRDLDRRRRARRPVRPRPSRIRRAARRLGRRLPRDLHRGRWRELDDPRAIAWVPASG